MERAAPMRPHGLTARCRHGTKSPHDLRLLLALDHLHAARRGWADRAQRDAARADRDARHGRRDACALPVRLSVRAAVSAWSCWYYRRRAAAPDALLLALAASSVRWPRSPRPPPMLAAMGERSFVVVVAYIKTEPMQVAIFGLIFLGDAVSAADDGGDHHRDRRRRGDVVQARAA